MSYTLKISVYNNRDYEQPFIAKNSDGSVYDLTGCTLSFGYANDEKTVAIHITGNPANKCLTVTNAAAGEFKLSLPYSVLKALPVGAYTHDLILTDTASKRTGLWTGTMQVKKGVA